MHGVEICLIKMNHRTTAIALGVGAATAAGLSLLSGYTTKSDLTDGTYLPEVSAQIARKVVVKNGKVTHAKWEGVFEGSTNLEEMSFKQFDKCRIQWKVDKNQSTFQEKGVD